jgi:hypothetical protein
VACAETMRKPPGIGAPGCGLGTTAGGLFSVGSIPSQPLRSSNAVIINDTKKRATIVGFIAAEFPCSARARQACGGLLREHRLPL